MYYKIFGKYLKKNFLQKHLVKRTNLKKFAYMKKLDAQAVQDVVERIDRAYQLFFRNVKRKIRCSPPKLKKVANYHSFTLKQNDWKLDEENNILTATSRIIVTFNHKKFLAK